MHERQLTMFAARSLPRARRRSRLATGLGLAVAASAGFVGSALAQSNTPPTAFEVADWTRRDVPLVIRLGGLDADGDALTFAIDTAPAHGSLSCSPSTWRCTYSPRAGYLGDDRFSGPNAAPTPDATPEPTPEPSAEVQGSPPANEPPVARAGGPYEVDEGAEVRLDGRDSSDPDGEIVGWSWDHEKRLDDASVPRPRFEASDDGRFEVELTVTDDAGASDGDRAVIRVRNLDPSVVIEAEATATVGRAHPIGITIQDPGREDRHVAHIDWGDGASEEVAVVRDHAGETETVRHEYADAGSFQIVIEVSDDDGGSARSTLSVQVEPAEG